MSASEEESDEEENAEQDACLAVDKWNHKKAKLFFSLLYGIIK